VLLHGELQGGKTLDVESIYQYTFVEHPSPSSSSNNGLREIEAIADFVDSAAFAGIGGGEDE
jgi:hypothetical protein